MKDVKICDAQLLQVRLVRCYYLGKLMLDVTIICIMLKYNRQVNIREIEREGEEERRRKSDIQTDR